MPILWHVIQIYAHQGFDRFLLATGYRGELIERFAGEERWPEGLSVSCVDTGVETETGERLRRIGPLIAGDGTFCATYADGLADIDLSLLLDFHSEHDGLATMSVVRPRLQFGVTEMDADGLVVGFQEKPRAEQWINGGFFCFQAKALSYIEPQEALERAPLERLAAAGELHAYRHGGFWECMDTYKDAVAMNDLWAAGSPPWRLWG